MVGRLLNIPFRIASSKTGWDGWLLTDEEKEELGEAVKPALDYYLPLFIKEHFLLIYAVSSIAGVFMDKDIDYRKWKKIKEGDED